MMRIWIIFLLATLGLSDSIATAQLIPRRGVTRPYPKCTIPDANYQFRNRSLPIIALSHRYVYLDNPVESLNLTPGSEVTGTKKITTISTEREVSNNANDEQPVVVGSANPNETAIPSIGIPLTPGTTTEKTTLITQEYPIDSNSLATIERKRKLFQWRQRTFQIDQCSVSNVALQLDRDGNWIVNLRADQNRVPTIDPKPYNPTLHIKRNEFAVVFRCYGDMAAATTEISMATGKPVVAVIKVKKFWVENGEPKLLVDCGRNGWVKEHFDLIDRVEMEYF